MYIDSLKVRNYLKQSAQENGGTVNFVSLLCCRSHLARFHIP